MSLSDFYVGSLVMYILWQLLYLLKTELLDSKILNRDRDLMTSLRWLSEKKPHPLLYFFRRNKIMWHPILLLMGSQFVITVVTILPVPLYWNSKSFHAFVLIAVFVLSIWNAAGFYFSVLGENRPKKKKQPTGEENAEESSEKVEKKVVLASSYSRLLSFIIFFIICVVTFHLAVIFFV